MNNEYGDEFERAGFESYNQFMDEYGNEVDEYGD